MIIQWPDLTLKKKSVPVMDITKHANLIEEMKTLVRLKKAWGLAAIQVGVEERFCVVRYGSEIVLLVNPEITKRSKQRWWMREGCLSLPGKTVVMGRYKRVTVRFTTDEGRSMSIRGDGAFGACLQHEIDHMDGITINDLGPVPELVRKGPLTPV